MSTGETRRKGPS